jgi:hypothetical protein
LILLWLEGGPSQLETFDPHPGSSIGGETKGIVTSVRGIEVADNLPLTAEQMHRMSIIRSVMSKEGDHARGMYNMKTGYRPDPTLIHPAVGAIVCNQLEGGAEIPRHISILPGNVAARGGYLGAAYDAFKVYDVAGPIPDVRHPASAERYQRRVKELTEFMEPEFARDRLAKLDAEKTLHLATTRAAMTMMTSEQLSAFDVSQESREERNSFGDSPFGRGCLAAARLIEVGVRCVEVALGGWDSHVRNHELQKGACGTLDPALAGLFRRLAARDLLETTLVVCGGEFGRTPQINPAGGRDHWPHGFSIVMGGCGINAGICIGGTNPEPKLDPAKPTDDLTNPVTVSDLHATILHALGIQGDLEVTTPIGRPMRLSDGKPIKQLLTAF